ncbi:hypothetical protein ASE09_33250 [Streptomyces sp. Root66D1]|nr:hypothetical protein ASD33_33270 [Streptomyces sp. Root1304]KRA86240.1 hypothetical protein ASE09_33250 [Streptomyces sp. Root66D1]
MAASSKAASAVRHRSTASRAAMPPGAPKWSRAAILASHLSKRSRSASDSSTSAYVAFPRAVSFSSSARSPGARTEVSRRST